jgi:ATP-dependent Clp protease ATP-binding subunit ClpC
MWQKRFEVILDYAISRLEQQGHPKNSDKLFIDNAVALMRIGRSAQDNMTLANVLKPYLEKGQLQVILEATPEEWNVLQEIDRGFTDLFEVFRVPSADLALATEILLHQRMRLEREYNCQISNIALHRICSLQRSYLRQKALPGAIVDLLRQIVVKYKNRSIEEQDVMNEFAASCRMQTKILDSAVGFAPREVERAIAAKLIGQPEAVDCLIQSIHLLKAKLNDPDKPLSFMFIGPTGVGKTQAAKVLNSYLFSGEEDMVRFDMNEYIDPYSVFRLIGNLDLPEGQLTGRIRHRPFCVLLFDEIEKAHASVHDLLLQLLGEGRLTDALGRTVDFTNTIVIMTSNVGAREANKALGFGSKIEQAQSIYHKALAQSFRPEFLNRIDRIVSFGQLSLEDIKQIARLQIEEILQRDGFMRRTTILSVSQSALDMVASKGFAPDLGGRALKRSIEREITNLAADQLISVQGDVPVLFQISNRDGQLYPHIIALEFLPRDLQWQIPISPQPGQTNSALEQLVASAEEIIVQINKDIDRFNAIEQNTTADQIPSMLQTENYLLREMIAELKSEISEVLWCANLPSFDLIPRYRQLRSGRKHLWRVSMFYVDELMAAIEIREFLREALINSPKAFADSQAEYLNYFLQMDYYQYLTRHPLQEQECRLYLHIYSMIEAKGQIEVSYLTNAYRDILKHLGFSTQNIDLDHQAASFTVIRSHRACNILQAEAGIHLFYLPFLSPIPVYVAIGQIPDHQSEPECCKLLANLSESQQAPAVEQSEQFANITPSEYYIIRLYCLKYADSKDDGSIHDLRTNLINKPNLSNQDWLLLLSAGWRQQTQTL